MLRARFGAWLSNVEAFDAACFSISAPEAELMDAQQRLLLEVSWEALAQVCIMLFLHHHAVLFSRSWHAVLYMHCAPSWCCCQQPSLSFMVTCRPPTTSSLSPPASRMHPLCANLPICHCHV